MKRVERSHLRHSKMKSQEKLHQLPSFHLMMMNSRSKIQFQKTTMFMRILFKSKMLHKNKHLHRQRRNKYKIHLGIEDRLTTFLLDRNFHSIEVLVRILPPTRPLHLGVLMSFLDPNTSTIPERLTCNKP